MDFVNDSSLGVDELIVERHVERHVELVSDLEKIEFARSPFVVEGENVESEMLEDEDEVLLMPTLLICSPSVMSGIGCLFLL